MSPRIFTLLALLLMVAAGSNVQAAEPDAAKATDTLAVEVQELRDHQRTALADLQARLIAATDPADSDLILQEMKQVKRGGEIELMSIQARHARLRGHDELALDIERNIRRLLDPESLRTPLNPVQQPASDTDADGENGGRK